VKPPLEKLNVQLPANVIQKLTAISLGCDKSLDWVIARASNFYLLHEGRDVLNSIEGSDQIARGEFEDIDDVIADIERIIR